MLRDRRNLAVLGRQIRLLRKERRLTQEQLATLIDVTTNHVGMLERGERTCSILVLIDLARALRVAPSHLVEPLDRLTAETGLP